MENPIVTAYIPCHNYEEYLEQAVQSVLDQTLTSWELIIIDDGSDDDSRALAEEMRARDPDRIRTVRHDEPEGLQACSNKALEMARGRYVMRLDADDYLDENALLVMVEYLDDNPDTALVYPNHFFVDEDGNILGVEQRKSPGEEDQVLDLPAHGACTMIRKRVLKSVGGYTEVYDRQDGYELWLKVSRRYEVGHVETPLFFYRQHGDSLTQDVEELLSTRADIKRDQVEREAGPVRPDVLAVVRAKNTYEQMPNLVLEELAGKPLIDYTLNPLKDLQRVDKTLVTTDDEDVQDYCEERPGKVATLLRPQSLSDDSIYEGEILVDAVAHVEDQGFHPDIIVSLNLHCPLRDGEHIQQAIDTLLLYDTDSVISVCEDKELHYLHGKNGLEALNPAMHNKVRPEREALFVDNGAIHTLWRESLSEADLRGKDVGHIVMPRWSSFRIRDHRDAWLLEQILEARREGRALRPETWAEKATPEN